MQHLNLWKKTNIESVLTAKTRLKTKRIYLIKFMPQVSILRPLIFVVVTKNFTVSPDGLY